jgi:hypothetical protein
MLELKLGTVGVRLCVDIPIKDVIKPVYEMGDGRWISAVIGARCGGSRAIKSI